MIIWFISMIAYDVGKLLLVASVPHAIYKIADWRNEIQKPIDTYEYIIVRYK